MLSRFCNSSLKVVRFKPIANHGYLAPTIRVLSQKSNYATALKSNSLEYTIESLKNRMENKARVTKVDLRSLLAKIKDKKIDGFQANEILNICCHSEKDSNVLVSIWEELKKQDIAYQIQHYNALLKWAKQKHNTKLAQQFFDELIKANIKPNINTYKYLLCTYCADGDINKAIEVLEMMNEDNLYLDDGAFNSLIQCHILCGNIEAANETKESLKQSGRKLYSGTLETYLKHYAKAGDLDNVIKTFDRFNEENIELLNQDVLRAICELAEIGMVDKIDTLLPYLKVNFDFKTSLENLIPFFVKKKQTVHLIKLIQLTDGDASKLYKKLIDEMVRLSSPEAEFNEVFEKLEASGFTMENNFNIFRSAIDCSSEVIIHKLLTHMKSHSIEMHESMFQKLFQLSAKKGVKDVLDVVKLMCSDFKIQPQISFIRDVILPGLDSQKRPEFAYTNLEATSINPRTLLVAIISEQLNNGAIKTAYEFATTKNYFYGIDLIKQPLVKAVTTSDNVSSFVSFVKLIRQSFSEINKYYRKSEISKDEIVIKQNDFVGEILSSAIKNCSNNSKLVKDLLNEFVEEGLSINIKVADDIQSQLKVDDNTQVGRLIHKLRAGNLTLKPIMEQHKSTLNFRKNLSSSDVQNIMEIRKAHGNHDSNEKLLFLAYLREGNITEIEALLTKDKIILSNSDYAMLVDMYSAAGNLENALNMLKRASTNNSSFQLDCIKVAKLVKLMFESNRPFEEIEAILVGHSRGKPEFRIFEFERIMERLASNGQVQLVQKLFDTLIKYNYIEVTADLTGHLVQASLKNKEYAEAVDKFEYIANTYQLVPMAMVLFIQLIQNNEADLLQRAYEIFEQKWGTRNALCSLGLAFVECGKDRQAKTVFENEQVTNLSKSIFKASQEYVKYGKLESAKTLLTATQGLYCNRHVIYQSILDIYIKENKAEEALKLWCEYCNDDMQPTQTFKNKFATLLNANSIELPFDLNLNNEKE